METAIKFTAGLIAFVALIFVLGMIMAFPIMWMWNYVMPDVFGLPQINVWQSFWGCFMIRLIFSGTHVTASKRG